MQTPFRMELEQFRGGLCLCWWQETESSSEQVSTIPFSSLYSLYTEEHLFFYWSSVKPRAPSPLFPSTWSVPFTFPFLSCSKGDIGNIAHLLGCFVLSKFQYPCISEIKEAWAHHSNIKRLLSSPLSRHSPYGHSPHISILFSTQWNSQESFMLL